MFEFLHRQIDKNRALSLEDHVLIRTLVDLDEKSMGGQARFALSSRESLGRQLADTAREVLVKHCRIEDPMRVLSISQNMPGGGQACSNHRKIATHRGLQSKRR